jgi:hypothetical protein
MAEQFVLSNHQEFDSNGLPLAGAKLYFFESGTTTPATTYSDNALSVANAHPIVADASGRFGPIYLAVDDYKIQLDNSSDVNQWTNDPYVVVAGSTPGAGLGVIGTTLNLAKDLNEQTGTSYTYVDGDRAKQVTHSNANAIAGTLPQAGASSEFIDQWFTDVYNKGIGLVTITPTTSTINGAATLVIPRGMNAHIISDGSNYIAQLSKNEPIYPDDGELTIASGVITVTGPNHTVDNEADAADDDLDTINGFIDGFRLKISSADDARNVTVKHGTGNIQLENSADCFLGLTIQSLELQYSAAETAWIEVGRTTGQMKLIQRVEAFTGATASTAVTIPDDDTIPQITEGAQALSQAFTPKSIRSVITISTVVNLSHSGTSVTSTALFDGNTDALRSTQVWTGGGARITNHALQYLVANTTTGARTYSLRYGASSATTYLNGTSAGRKHGGVMTTSMIIEEWEPI